jgi:hypothetical protein
MLRVRTISMFISISKWPAGICFSHLFMNLFTIELAGVRCMSLSSVLIDISIPALAHLYSGCTCGHI